MRNAVGARQLVSHHQFLVKGVREESVRHCFVDECDLSRKNHISRYAMLVGEAQGAKAPNEIQNVSGDTFGGTDGMAHTSFGER